MLCFSSRFHQPQCDTSQRLYKAWHIFTFVTDILWQTHTETPHWDCVVPDTWWSKTVCAAPKHKNWEQIPPPCTSHFCLAKPFNHKYTLTKIHIPRDAPNLTRFPECYSIKGDSGVRLRMYFSIYMSDFTFSVWDNWHLLKAGVCRKSVTPEVMLESLCWKATKQVCVWSDNALMSLISLSSKTKHLNHFLVVCVYVYLCACVCVGGRQDLNSVPEG